MTLAYFITHPDVMVDPEIPITQWPLSDVGRQRMRGVLDHAWVSTLSHVFCSEEQKARDGADIMKAALGMPVALIADLGENDRSTTGFLPPAEFWEVVEQFFDEPDSSVRGWERASDAQARVADAVKEALARTRAEEPVAFVAHGGVGSLLLCHLKGVPISRLEEQPGPPAGSAPGTGGGYYFTFDRSSLAVQQDWQRIDRDGPGRETGTEA
jgi:broad specificity phosphatase PhoE